ncbi:MAG: ATP-binding cassette domain-containing protein, partial [Candidatus Dojkabacteria bacterium]|nr:ATP-binding cassette domain-containing protein [Candidatus Dojkabacteria bacterium]
MLSINELTVSKGGKNILNNINLFLARGEKIGLVGVNGAGKTTLLKILAKVDEPDLGTISLSGTFSYLSQEIHMEILESMKEELTIGEYLIIERGLNVEEWEINKLLNYMNMQGKDTDSLLSQLSGGQKIKVE